MEKLLKKIETLQKRADYIDQYVDSYELLAIGTVIGIIGGIWGNILNNLLSHLFGSYYFGVLSAITLIVIYFFGFPIRRARKMLNENLVGIDSIAEDLDIEI